MRRTIWPVGHGTFCTEEFWCTRHHFTVVYDCGSMNTRINERVEEFCDYLGHPDNAKPIVNMVFISHFHQDHINGLKTLLDKADVKHIILPQIDNKLLAEAYVYNLYSSSEPELNEGNTEAQNFIYQLATNCERFREVPITRVSSLVENQEGENYDAEEFSIPSLESGSKITLRHEDNGNVFWELIPINVCRGTEMVDDLLSKLHTLTQANETQIVDEANNVNFDVLRDWAMDEDKRKKLVDAYKEVFGKNNLNASCMPLYSGPIESAMATVIDFEGYTRIDRRMRRFYQCYDDCFLDSCLIRHTIACLYMGDFEPLNTIGNKTYFEIMIEQLSVKRWTRIGLQQIPHHASCKNHFKELYENPKICFANINGERDTSFSQNVIYDIQKYCAPIVVTELGPMIREQISISL